jgi:uncharacterized protein (TIGR03546 family)
MAITYDSSDARQAAALSPDRPRQIAWGVVLGLALGLLPKDSLFVLGGVVIACTTAASLSCAIGSGVVFSVLGWALQPFLHKLGAVVLTHDSLLRLWAMLYQLPLGPWTRLNNTLVMGGLVSAAMLAAPVFHLTRKVARRFVEPRPRTAWLSEVDRLPDRTMWRV